MKKIMWGALLIMAASAGLARGEHIGGLLDRHVKIERWHFAMESSCGNEAANEDAIMQWEDVSRRSLAGLAWRCEFIPVVMECWELIEGYQNYGECVSECVSEMYSCVRRHDFQWHFSPTIGHDGL